MNYIVEVDENHRLRVEYDDGPADPRKEWDGHLTAVVNVQRNETHRYARCDFIAPVQLYPDEANVEAADDRLFAIRVSPWRSEAEQVIRFVRIFYGLVAEYDEESQCYWVFSPTAWRKWNDVAGQEPSPLPALVEQERIIREERRTYQDYSEGNVYGVIAEQMTSHRTEVFDRETGALVRVEVSDEEWDQTDSLWGIFPDDEERYDAEKLARRVASENFAPEYTSKENA